MSKIKSYTNNRIALVTAFFTAVFFISLFLYLGFNLREYIYEDSKELAKEISRKAAVETEQYFTSALMVTRSMGSRALLIREMNGTREQIIEILTNTLNRHQNILGTWTLWESNAFDGKDHLFTGRSDHNPLGTLGYGYFKVDDMVHKEIMSEGDYERPYYALSRDTKKEQIVEPYNWRYSGYQDIFFGTSISYPLVYEDVFLGVIGVDIDLVNLRERINQERLYQSGYLSLISSNGMIISHIDSTFISNNLFDLINDSDSLVYNAISNGSDLTLETRSEFTDKKVFRFFYPISIGSGKPWSIMVEIPINDATSRTNQLLIVAAIILIVGLGLIIFLIFNILDRRRYEKAIFYALKEVKNKERIASQNEQNYREIFNSTSEAIFIHNIESGEIIDVNNVAIELYGFIDKSEFINSTIGELSLNKQPYTTKDAIRHFKKTLDEGPQVFEWISRKRDGQLFWSEVSLKSSTISGDTRILAVLRDVDEKKKNALELEKYRNHLEFLVKERTEELAAANDELQTINDELVSQRSSLLETLAKLKETQNQLIQAEKMASLGLLSAGIAHEINNPLNFIHGGIIGLEKHFEEASAELNDDVKLLIHAIKEGVRRSTEIVRSLNQYSRADNQNKRDCNINKIIDNCLMILHNQTKDSIQVVKKYSNQALSLNCKEGQLHQAIINILTNAIHSIKDNGIITIQTTDEKNFCKIIIADNGCGISKSNIEKVTDPFFTTKEPGKGTGLGLSITASIIHDHGGSLKIKSEEGKGTTVTIKLSKT